LAFNLRNFALARYDANGVLDTTFGNGGKVITDFAGNVDSAQGVAVQQDGKILAAGYRSTSSSNTSDFVLARYDADGTLDTSFGTGGKSITDFFGLDDFGNALILQPDGNAVIAGSSFQTGPGTDSTKLALARYVVSAPASFSLSFDPALATGERGTTVKVK